MLRFSEGLIPVKANASNKYGFVDTSGEVAVPFRFDLPVLPFSCGLALTQNGEYIDKNGEVVIPRPAGDYETTGGTTFYENTALQVGGKGTTTVYSLELVTN
jgi:hypothetical protein